MPSYLKVDGFYCSQLLELDGFYCIASYLNMDGFYCIASCLNGEANGNFPSCKPPCDQWSSDVSHS